MTNQNRFRLSKLALCIALAVGAVPAMAQNTTSALGGRITSADGKPVNGAQIMIVHKESGSTNNVTTDAEGRYSARGLRVGGPYTITITKDGVTEKRENVFLQLAETASLDAKLGGGVVTKLDTIAVTAQSAGSDKFSNTAMGTGTSLGRQEIDAFASIQRNLQDYARTDARVAQTDKGRGEISVGGQNSRYNKITIDGVNISDTFGLESNGLPTLKQPISIDAIQSVQVNVSNYDVTQTGYTGGGINAVTKSGTNEFHGSVSLVGRNEKYVGDRYNFSSDKYTQTPAFKESTVGFTLGGPIIKDTLFFYAGYEQFKSTRNVPDIGPLGSSASTVIGITPTAIAGAQSTAQSRYGIDIGALSASGRELDVKDALVKLDWNINKNHRASVRYTKTDQSEPLFPNFFPTPSTALSLSSNWYTQEKTIETVVGQWFADWTPNFSTETKISTRDYNSVPKNNANLPQITLGFTGVLPVGTPASVPTGTRNLVFGTERSRHTNVLDTKTLDAYFGGNYNMGEHELKFAGDYQDNKIVNAFLQDTKGNYTFNCQNSTATYTYTFGTVTCANALEIERATLENFSRGRPTTYSVQVPAQAGGSLDDGIAKFNIRNYGVALQDTWTVNPNLTLMYGVRLDTSSIPQTPLRNSAAAAPLIAGSVNGSTIVRQTGGFGLDNTVTIDGEKLVQPRVGFNYTFDSKRPMQLRGGVGLFQGAAANVWLSNGFANPGVATRLVGCGGNFTKCPDAGGIFSADPANQQTNFAGAAPAANVDFIDGKLAQPSVWKGNLAFDMELPWGGIVAGFEYLYTKTETGIYYQHLNLGAPTRIGSDGRQLFYTASGLNPACWSATGTRITTGTVCGVDNRTRALSNRDFAEVLLAAKTREGRGDLATVSLSGQLFKQVNWGLAYTYTEAKEVNGLTSSVSLSNWRSRAAVNPNESNASNSAYLVKDRISGTVNWSRAFIPGYKTTVGVFYEGRSGKPYSWTFSNDANGDALAGNDLMFIPKAPGSGEVVFVGDTATDKTNENRFWSIVNANSALSSARGSTVRRNESLSPWSNNIDMRVSQEVPSFFKGHKAVFVLDILNFGNLLNKKWGHIDEMAFQANGGNTRGFVNFAGLDDQGRYRYIVNSKADDFTTRQDRGESQWALQATFRYEF
jgi:Carboxypeptidase regulatory-like domain/TonB dependent receptor